MDNNTAALLQTLNEAAEQCRVTEECAMQKSRELLANYPGWVVDAVNHEFARMLRRRNDSANGIAELRQLLSHQVETPPCARCGSKAKAAEGTHKCPTCYAELAKQNERLKDALHRAGDEPNIDRARAIADTALAACSKVAI